MKRIALTGATGIIGMALIQQCVQRKIEVYALVRKNSQRNKYIPKHDLVHLVDCNLEELWDFDIRKIPNCDVFYHLGWTATTGILRNDMAEQIRNIQYTLDAVTVAKKLGCQAFVGAGSQAEYGRYEGKLSEDTPTFPDNGYGMAKLCAGQMSQIECQKMGLRYVWTRILSVYGPYDGENTMVMSTIRKLLNNEKPSLTRGEQQWDYLFSEDAAKAMILLGEQKNACGVYCLGSGQTQTIKKYVLMIKDKINPTAEISFGDIPYGEKQLMYLCADLKKLTHDISFRPERSFEEGIQITVDWMKKRLNNEEN